MSLKKTLSNAGFVAALLGIGAGGFAALILLALGFRALVAAVIALPLMFAWNLIAPENLHFGYLSMWAFVFVVAVLGGLISGGSK